MAQSFFPIVSFVDVAPGLANQWVNVDVSSYIPSGASGVLLHTVNPSNYISDFGLRKKGSLDNFINELHSAYYHNWAMIGVDANRIFQCYLGRLDRNVYLVGYTSSGVTFFTNSYTKNPTAGLWETLDCSTEAPNAIALIFEITKVMGATTYGWCIRKPKSTDTSLASTDARFHSWFIVGCDSQQRVEGFRSSTEIDFHLVGYVTDGVTLLPNRSANLRPATTRTWLDINLSSLPNKPSSGDMGFFHFQAPGFSRVGLRKDSSGENIYLRGFQELAIIEITNDILEGYAWAGDEVIYLLGSMPAPPEVTTNVATNISDVAARLNGTLAYDGGVACECGFEWGLTIAYGNTTPTQSKLTGQTFAQPISGLSPATTYHFRALARNATATSYGSDATFTTAAEAGRKGNILIDQLYFQHVERMRKNG